VKGLKKLENINPQIPSFRKHFDSPEVLVECAQFNYSFRRSRGFRVF
jgi:hypothetical protein